MNGIAGTAGWSGCRTFGLFAVGRGRIGFGGCTWSAGRWTGCHRGRRTWYGRWTRCRANVDRIERTDAAGTGWPNRAVAASRSRSRTTLGRDGTLLLRRLRDVARLLRQQCRGINDGRDGRRGRSNQRTRFAHPGQYGRADALQGQRLWFLRSSFLTDLQGDRLTANVVAGKRRRSFSLG